MPGVTFFLRSGVIGPSQSALPSSYAALRAALHRHAGDFATARELKKSRTWVTPSTLHRLLYSPYQRSNANIHVVHALSHVGEGRSWATGGHPRGAYQRQSAYGDCAPWRSRPPLDDPGDLASFSFFPVTGKRAADIRARARSPSNGSSASGDARLTRLPSRSCSRRSCRARPWKSRRSRSAASPSSEGCQLPRRPRQRSTVSEKTSGTSTAAVASALTRPGPMPLQPAARRAT